MCIAICTCTCACIATCTCTCMCTVYFPDHRSPMPITEFVECLYIKFDFDMAQQKLVECEKVNCTHAVCMYIVHAQYVYYIHVHVHVRVYMHVMYSVHCVYALAIICMVCMVCGLCPIFVLSVRSPLLSPSFLFLFIPTSPSSSLSLFFPLPPPLPPSPPPLLPPSPGAGWRFLPGGLQGRLHRECQAVHI